MLSTASTLITDQKMVQPRVGVYSGPRSLNALRKSSQQRVRSRARETATLIQLPVCCHMFMVSRPPLKNRRAASKHLPILIISRATVWGKVADVGFGSADDGGSG